MLPHATHCTSSYLLFQIRLEKKRKICIKFEKLFGINLHKILFQCVFKLRWICNWTVLILFFSCLITGLLEDVALDSREYLKDIQPLVLKQYRDVASRGKFLFTKAKLVHNDDLAREVSIRLLVAFRDKSSECIMPCFDFLHLQYHLAWMETF